MNSWHSKSLGDGMWADVPSEEIRKLFQSLFESKDKPMEMAVFTRYEEGRLHCEVVVYFSPAAVEASPCEKPTREGLKLLAGEEGCWSAIFV